MSFPCKALPLHEPFLANHQKLQTALQWASMAALTPIGKPLTFKLKSARKKTKLYVSRTYSLRCYMNTTLF